MVIRRKPSCVQLKISELNRETERGKRHFYRIRGIVYPSSEENRYAVSQACIHMLAPEGAV